MSTTTSKERIRALVPPHTQVGESPLYRKTDNTLHYVDVFGKLIHVIELSGGFNRRTIQCPENITFLGFHRDGGYIVCSFSSIVRVSEDGDWEVQKQIFSDTTDSRLNDAGIDCAGRLWVGSIDRVAESIPKYSPEPEGYLATGSIYRYDRDGNLKVMQQGGVITGNGLCWSPDHKLMYFVDSYKNCIWSYDFDVVLGEISNQRALVSRGNAPGEADGLLTDVDGNLYTFLWEGGAVVKYSPNGELLRTWLINASRVTHGAWIGHELRGLVMTSAHMDSKTTTWDGEEGGALFHIPDCENTGLEKHLFG